MILAEALIGIDARRQRGGVRDFQGHKAFPFRLKRGHVDDDAASGVRRFTHANGQHLAGILKYSTERARAKEFGGTMQAGPVNSTKDRASKFFRIDDCGVDIRENFEFIGDAQIVAI